MMVERIARLALILLLVSLACSLPALPEQPALPPVEGTAVAAGQSFLQAPPDATATATPFQPFGPTATLRPTRTPNPTATFAPLEEEEEDVPAAPTPVRVTQKLPPGTVTFMVLGNDFRPGGGYRTDVMMLVAVHTGSGRVSVVSIPRDLYVTIPGWADQRINTAFPRGGFPMLADTLEYNFGVRPSFYVMTNFQGFVSIINSLGGVNVYAGSFLSDSCDLPQAVGGRCTVYAGPVSMDGATALWYVRSRYTSSDIDRLRRAQEVMYAMFVKLMNLNAVGRLPELYSSYRSSVETNISVEDLVPLLPVASQVIGDSSRLQRYSIGFGMVTNYITESGGQVLLPNHAAIQQLFAEAVFTE
jgi:polyisoprenyl-teichoic acid--peptidoglycan teichoic acid transferase